MGFHHEGHEEHEGNQDIYFLNPNFVSFVIFVVIRNRSCNAPLRALADRRRVMGNIGEGDYAI